MSYIREPAKLTPYNAAAPFDEDWTVFAPHTIAAPVTITISSAPKIPGSWVVYRFIADGVNVPNISAFVRVANSLNYVNVSGFVNSLQILYDGTGYWCEWIRGDAPLPALTTIGLTFPVSNLNFANPTANNYSAINATPFSGSGGAAQAIPAGKNGQVTVQLPPSTILGLHNNNTAQAVPSGAPPYLYYIWQGGTSLYTGEAGTAVLSSVTNLSLTGTRYVQLRRVGTVVTAWYKLLVTDPWSLVATFAAPSSTALYPMLGTTSPYIATVVSLEVEP